MRAQQLWGHGGLWSPSPATTSLQEPLEFPVLRWPGAVSGVHEVALNLWLLGHRSRASATRQGEEEEVENYVPQENTLCAPNRGHDMTLSERQLAR